MGEEYKKCRILCVCCCCCRAALLVRAPHTQMLYAAMLGQICGGFPKCFLCSHSLFFPPFSSSPQLYPENKGQIPLGKWGDSNDYWIYNSKKKKKEKSIPPFVFEQCILWALPKVHLHSLHLLDTGSVYSNKVEKENASLKQRKSGNSSPPLFKLFHSPLFFILFFPFLWSPGQHRGCDNTAGCNQVTSITAYGVLSKITSLSETVFQPTTLWLHNRNSLRWATGTTSCAERVGNL